MIDMTIGRFWASGMGDYTDLVCIGEEFFPKPLWS